MALVVFFPDEARKPVASALEAELVVSFDLALSMSDIVLRERTAIKQWQQMKENSLISSIIRMLKYEKQRNPCDYLMYLWFFILSVV